MFISDPATKNGKDRRQPRAVNKLQSRTSCWAHCALLLSMFWAAQRWSRTSTLGRAGPRACWPCWPASCRARALGAAAGRVVHASAAARRACWLPLAAHAGRRCKRPRARLCTCASAPGASSCALALPFVRFVTCTVERTSQVRLAR